MLGKKLASAFALACALSVFAVYAMTSSSVVLRSVGAVKAIGVGVYWDVACSQAVSTFDWGMVEPNATKSVTVYIRNEGNSMITLSMHTENWSPPNASSYIAMRWDYGGQMIAPNAVIPVTLTLSIASDIRGIHSFSFDIIIMAAG
jgi:hypothetical protein